MITRGVTHLNTRTFEGQGRDFIDGWPAEVEKEKVEEVEVKKVVKKMVEEVDKVPERLKRVFLQVVCWVELIRGWPGCWLYTHNPPA